MSLQQFSTETIRKADRLAYMRDHYAAIENIELDFVDDDAPFAAGSTRILPGLSIFNATCSSCVSRRTRRHTADGNDQLVLCIITGGEIQRRFDGGEAEMFRQGEAYLGFSGLPSEHFLTDNTSYLDIAIPRADLTRAIVDPEKVARTRLEKTTALKLLADYALVLTRGTDDISPEEASLYAGHVFDLAAIAVGATRDAAALAKKRGLRAARLKALQADIAANASQPGLSIGAVAARHGISPQYLRTLFNSEGTTFSDFLLRQRLARVHQRLTDPQYVRQSISAVAFECGFGDLSYFNRTFRSHYGMTPSDVRAAAAQNHH
jgi:AraC-like DNA-binding protein